MLHLGRSLVMLSLTMATWIPSASALPHGDLNCDGFTNVVDIVMNINLSLGFPLSEGLDANQDGLPDACEDAQAHTACSCQQRLARAMQLIDGADERHAERGYRRHQAEAGEVQRDRVGACELAKASVGHRIGVCEGEHRAHEPLQVTVDARAPEWSCPARRPIVSEEVRHERREARAVGRVPPWRSGGGLRREYCCRRYATEQSVAK